MADHNLPFPTAEEGALITVLLIVDDVARSRDFYADVLGGEIVRQEAPAFVKLYNTWIIINTGGGGTIDKPDVTMAPPSDPNVAGIAMNIRVHDVQAMYTTITERGGQFLTEPKDMGPEIRCYLRDPDGYLIEFGQTTLTPEQLAGS